MESIRYKIDTVRRACGEMEIMVDGVEWEVGEVLDEIETLLPTPDGLTVVHVLGNRVVELETQLHDARERIDRINATLDKSLKNTREALDLLAHIQSTTDVNLTKLKEVEQAKAKRFF